MRNFIDMLTESHEPECLCGGYNPEELFMEAKGDPEALEYLKAKYIEFNNAFFDGELPIIPILWANLKTAGAAVRFKIATHQGKQSIVQHSIEMVFSTKYTRDRESLIPLLLHEMIHVYLLAVKENHRENHGPIFMAYRSRLMQRSGMDVPLSDNTAELTLADTSLKPVGVVLRRFMSGGKMKAVYAMLSANVLSKKLADVEKIFSRTTVEKVEARIVTSAMWSEKFQRSKSQRVISRSTSFYLINDESLADLLANSEVLWTNNGAIVD